MLLVMSGVLAIGGCRSLTENETSFLNATLAFDTARRTVDLSRVRIQCQLPDDQSVKRKITNELAEERNVLSIGQTQALEAGVQSILSGNALTLGETIYFKQSVCSSDFAGKWQDGGLGAGVHAPRLAHEILHVWHWQNRPATGYALWKVIAEHFRADPYAYEPLTPGKKFLSYRFEQQGQMVEDYVDLELIGGSPQKREALRRLINEALDIDSVVAKFARMKTRR